MDNIKGYLICRVCGSKEPQNVYDCDVLVVCKQCDSKDKE